MSRWSGKYVIGLTGNIAVGKSVVRQMLQHLGAYTIDADGLGHQAMSPGAPAYKPIVDRFGQFILNSDNTINRAQLAEVVFSNPTALKQLEDITHPIIRQAINTLVTRAKQPVIVIEAIKLLEGDLKDAVDTVWVVNAKPQTQYTRLIGKRKMSEDAAKKRILSQPPQGEKLKAANVVIENDGNVEETWKQVQAGWNSIRQQLTKSAPPAATSTPATPAQTAPAAQQTPATKPAEEPVKPAATTAAPTDTSEETTVIPADTSGITVKRGMPSNAEVIAGFITKATGQDVGRMDVIMSFGQKSYLLANDTSNTTLGLAGWQVENLITRVDEIYIQDSATKSPVIYALVAAIEEASKELQSEVSFIFLPSSTGQDIIDPFVQSGYELTTVKDIKIPAWREAVQEAFTDGMTILTKKLRKDRILKPI